MSETKMGPPPSTTPDKPAKRPRGRPKGSKSRKRIEGDAVRLAVPVGPPPDPDLYCTPRIDLNGLTPRQARAYRRIFVALNEAHATMDNGRHVDRQPDAIRWLLEQVADAIE